MTIGYRAELRDRLLAAARRHPERTALWVDDRAYTYRELFARADTLAGRLDERDEPFCLVYCGRNLTRYVAILASLLAGKAFVPMCPTSPPAYCEKVLKRLDGQVVAVLDSGDPDQDDRLRTMMAPPAPVLDHGPGPRWEGEPRRPQGGAYLMFTSGSTGVPKAVLVTLDNLTAYLDGAIELFGPTCEDRFAQVNNFTFDLSVHDIALPWTVGAAVYALPDQAVYKLPALVREHALTFWLSVPTTGVSLLDLGLLRPGALPSLRRTLFCGEPLPRRLAQAWHAANPDGELFNVYGPTECTIAVTSFGWRPDQDLPDVVPIGWPYPRQEVRVVGADLAGVAAGQTGELLLRGSQLVPGYHGDPEQTAARFVELPDAPGRWYRTGDLVAHDPRWGLVFKGRRDDQMQVRGHRVERLEVETLLRQVLGTEAVAVVGWPMAPGGLVQGLVAFVADTATPVPEMRRRISRELPEHLWPSRIHVGPLPQNRSLKVDYPQLRRRLEEES
ncbi:AMP-binding protein [Micromonospora aurantiaca (nom. illeg.)]|uniref:AMP-binding protein n=1 Tax=Micromonospora aurantiaca (nom. illeg.) TaxID=47850 RepID=UPI0016145154